MSCVKNRKPLLAGLTSVSSMIGFILMPKCPLCLAIGLSAIGITGVSLRPSSILSLAVAVAASFAIRLFSTGPLVPLAAGVLIAIFFALYWSSINGRSKAWRRSFQAYSVRRRASRIR